jgi:hypothetical protein
MLEVTPAGPSNALAAHPSYRMTVWLEEWRKSNNKSNRRSFDFVGRCATNFAQDDSFFVVIGFEHSF